MDSRQLIRPQSGFQERFLSTPADIAIGGGAAGAGKTYALLMEPLRNIHVPGFGAVFFRRTTPQIKTTGGLWDTSQEIYGKITDPNGAKPSSTENPYRWKFPGGQSLLFTHLQHEHTVRDWDGAQVPLIIFDELIHFQESQFWYMISRNRTTCGVRPYVRCATNPQPWGWVKRLISWWLYPDDWPETQLRGFPRTERAGKLRYYFKHGEAMYWGDQKSQVLEQLPAEISANQDLIKSIAFIPGLLDDNKVLREKDPSYEANLYAQSKQHGDRLRNGRWYAEAGENDFWTPGQIEDLFTTTWVPQGERFLSCDIAMEGSDSFVVGYWSGLRLEKIYKFQKQDGAAVLQTIERLAKEHHVPGSQIVFDTNGVGNYLKGFLRGAFDFRSNARPIEIQGSRQNFDCLRSQCLYKLSEFVSAKSLYFCEKEDRNAIVEDLVPHKKEDKSGVLSATPKSQIAAEIGHSPDIADMIIMRMVFELKNRKKSSLTQPKAAST